MPRRTASVLVAALASAALLLPLAPAVAAPQSGPGPARIEDPTVVVKGLARKVNRRDREGARKFATRAVVRAMLAKRKQGFRFEKPVGDPCQLNTTGEADWDCGLTLLYRGQTAGTAYLKVSGTYDMLGAHEVAIAVGERVAARTIGYPGHGIDVPRGTDPAVLVGTPADFQAFVTARLDYLWGWTDNDPACATAPLVTVKRYSTKGYAQISNEGVFATNDCARGGNEAIYVKLDGVWQAPLGTQDGYKCRKLRTYDVPRKIAPRTCYARGDQVRYRP